MSAPGRRPPDGDAEALAAWLAAPLRVIHVGLEAFAEDLAVAGALAVAVDWRPPAGGDPGLAALLAALEEDEDADLAAGQAPEGGTG